MWSPKNPRRINHHQCSKLFDPRFFYYDHYAMITEDPLQPTDKGTEEAKCEQWAILEEDLEPGLALDPTSYVAKAMQRKRKEPPTEAEVLSSVRKRPTTPPQEGADAGSPASRATPQGQVSLETLMEAVGTPPGTTAQPQAQESASGRFPTMDTPLPSVQSQGIQETVTAIDGTRTTITVTSAVTTTHPPGDIPGQSQPMEVSPSSEQSAQQAEPQSTDQHPSQETATGGIPPAEQGIASVTEHPERAPQEEMSETEKLRQGRVDKLTRIMLESIHQNDIGIRPAAEAIYKAVSNFAVFASQFDHLAQAQDRVPEYAGRCMSNFCEHYAQRAMQGYDDDSELVDALCVAHDAMPTLLPAAFAECVEEEQREAQAQSIELERRRKEQEELEQRIADREELDAIQQEIEEAERSQSSQPRQANAAEITQLMIGRMADLANQKPFRRRGVIYKHSIMSCFGSTLASAKNKSKGAIPREVFETQKRGPVIFGFGCQIWVSNCPE